VARGDIIRQVLVDRYLCIYTCKKSNILIAREYNPFISPCLFSFLLHCRSLH